MPVSGDKHPFTERSLANVPDVSGVYSLHSNGKVVYIGESGQLQTRLRQHRAGQGAPGPEKIEEYKYERVRGERARKNREDALLLEYKAKHRRPPRYNTQMPS